MLKTLRSWLFQPHDHPSGIDQPDRVVVLASIVICVLLALALYFGD